MNITLPTIQLDLDTDNNRSFAEWYMSHDDPDRIYWTKHLLLSGFSALEAVDEYVHRIRDDTLYKSIKVKDGEIETMRKMLDSVTSFAETTTTLTMKKVHEKSLLAAQEDVARVEATYDARIANIQAMQQAQLSELDASYGKRLATALSGKEDIEKDLQRTFMYEMSNRIADVNAEHQRVLQDMNIRHENDKVYRSMYESLLLRNEDCSIAILQKQLEMKDSRIAMLEGTCMGKGNLAEGHLMSLMRNLFDNYSIQDSSSTPASCDIHVYVTDVNFIAVESKNKDVITRGDLDKFVRDIDSLAAKHTDNFVGAIFVSTNSINIPGKGSFTFEIVAKRPVVYIAFAGIDRIDPDVVNKSVKMLVQVSAYLMKIDQHSGDVQDIITKIQPFVQQIDKANKDVNTIKNAAANIIKTCDSVRDNLITVFTNISNMVGCELEPNALVPQVRKKHRKVAATEAKLLL
jgi:hypothetical protein